MSGLQTPISDDAQSPAETEKVNIISPLENLQTGEQTRVLDTVAEVRKCGLESIVSLPQLVVCGDQSAGKSSVLEALTEIPFPRNENLCTRFATEIILRRALVDTLTMKVLPDEKRNEAEKAIIRGFTQSITDFDELPAVMDEAMKVMGISSTASDSDSHAFSKDVLSITIEGPSRPQLTLVDIPGLIGTATKGVTDNDVDLVAEITEHYIAQPRTICLAVVSAASDHATQSILKRVRDFDPKGHRTLGIITKPDRIEGNGSKQAFLELAQNEDIVLKLGWHVLKNRGPDMAGCSLQERNASESKWFQNDPIFKRLPLKDRGIDTLRTRLSVLLFEHVKKELPKLREELEEMLEEAEAEQDLMGDKRSTAAECKEYLSQISAKFQAISKAAIDGHYEGGYFHKYSNDLFDPTSPSSICRVRAVVQSLNTEFTKELRTDGHKYQIDIEDKSCDSETESEQPWRAKKNGKKGKAPIPLSKDQATKWARELYVRTRGKELTGNFNPLLIGELFWEQSCKWADFATVHVDRVADICSSFLDNLLRDECPSDVQPRILESIKDRLKARRQKAGQELKQIVYDLETYPINYNHHYIDSITERRQERQQEILEKAVLEATTRSLDTKTAQYNDIVDTKKVAILCSKRNKEDMEKVVCEEALDCLFSIYKVMQRTFIANITTQVIERHIVRGLDQIFDPIVVTHLSDEEAVRMAAEPLDAQRERARLGDKISKLKAGNEAFRNAMGVTIR